MIIRIYCMYIITVILLFMIQHLTLKMSINSLCLALPTLSLNLIYLFT